MARLQREIDFPCVFSLRIQMRVGLHAGLPPCPVRLRPLLAPPLATLRSAEGWHAQVHAPSLSHPTLHPQVLLSSLSLRLHGQLPRAASIGVRRGQLPFCGSWRGLAFHLSSPRVWGRIPPIPQTHLTRVKQIRAGALRTGMPLIQRIPLSIPLINPADLPKSLLLRYRAQMLKILGWSASQLEWAGVTPRLPPIPLRICEVAESLGQTRLLLVWTARHHAHLEGRIMAMVRQKGSQKWLFLPMREG